MLIGLSNVSNLLQPISCFLPILVTILIIFCYHSNGKSQINIRYLQIKKENDEKQFLFFSLLGGGGGGGQTYVPLCGIFSTEPEVKRKKTC